MKKKRSRCVLQASTLSQRPLVKQLQAHDIPWYHMDSPLQRLGTLGNILASKSLFFGAPWREPWMRSHVIERHEAVHAISLAFVK
jgi:hypothetical protein